MLTAGHCYTNGTTVLDGAGNRMGVTKSRNLSIDSVLIDVESVSGYIISQGDPDSRVPCTGYGTSTCYNDVFIVPIQNAARGGAVVTG